MVQRQNGGETRNLRNVGDVSFFMKEIRLINGT